MTGWQGQDDRPVAVLHVITSLDVGGAERMLVKLCSATDGRVVRHVVVCLKPEGPLAADLRAAGVEVISLGMAGAAALPHAVWRLRALLRQRRPDVVQTWLYHADLVGTLAVMTCGRRIPLAWNIRCTMVDFAAYGAGTRITVGLLARLSGRPDIIIANSTRGLEEHFALGYRPRRTAVLPNGFDTDRFCPGPEHRTRIRAALNIPADALVIAHVARFDVMKNHRGLLDAFLACGRSDAQLILIGRDVTAQAPGLADHPAFRVAGDRIHCPGERQDVEAWLAAADGFVNCSLYGEGFPNAVGEAMAVGLPCLVTAVGDAPVVVGDTGYIVPVDDTDALAAGLKGLIAMSPAERTKRSHAARQRVVDHYALPKVAAKYSALYRSLVGRSSHHGHNV